MAHPHGSVEKAVEHDGLEWGRQVRVGRPWMLVASVHNWCLKPQISRLGRKWEGAVTWKLRGICSCQVPAEDRE